MWMCRVQPIKCFLILMNYANNVVIVVESLFELCGVMFIQTIHVYTCTYTCTIIHVYVCTWIYMYMYMYVPATSLQKGYSLSPCALTLLSPQIVQHDLFNSYMCMFVYMYI